MSAQTGSDNIGFWFKLELQSNVSIVWRGKGCMWRHLYRLQIMGTSCRLFSPTAATEFPPLYAHFYPSVSPSLSSPSKSLISPFSLFSSPLFLFGFLFPLIFFRGPSIIHLPSREVFPEGKLLWRPAWPRTASDWPSACLPFCILHCLFNKEQSECDFQGRVPVIVALTPCLSNDPHYGASDSSLKGLIYEYAGTAAPQASTHRLLSAVSPPSVSTHRLYIHVRGRSHTYNAYTCAGK